MLRNQKRKAINKYNFSSLLLEVVKKKKKKNWISEGKAKGHQLEVEVERSLGAESAKGRRIHYQRPKNNSNYYAHTHGNKHTQPIQYLFTIQHSLKGLTFHRFKTSSSKYTSLSIWQLILHIYDFIWPLVSNTIRFKCIWTSHCLVVRNSQVYEILNKGRHLIDCSYHLLALKVVTFY